MDLTSPARQGARATWRSLFWIAAGLVLGLALLALAADGIELAAIASGLSRAEPGWIALAFSTVLATTTAKILRWRTLFPGPDRPALTSLAKALLVGQLLNALLPARAGDVGRAYIVATETSRSGAASLGTVAAEKAFDVFLLVVCGAAAAAMTSLPAWLDLSLLAVAATGALLLVLVAFVPDRIALSWSRRWGRRLPWSLGHGLPATLLRGKTGLAALRQPYLALAALAWSILVWSLAAATNYLLFLAFRLPLSSGPALMLLVVLHIGVAPPSSPGRLGVFHALTVASLAVLGIDGPRSLAYATVLHAIVYLPQILPGALLLLLRRVSIDPRRAVRQADPASVLHGQLD